MSFLIICINANSQTILESSNKSEKASYSKEDLTKFLARKTQYPKDGITNNKAGDVVISFIIRKNGKLDSLVKVSSPDISLSANSIITMISLDKEWSPAKKNNMPIDKKYFVVFRYRIFLNTKPYDYKGQSNKLFEKQKYEKALILYNKGITDNQYDFELFESRAKVKEILGDLEGAKKDQLMSRILKDEIMSIVDIYAIGYTRVEKRIVGVQRVQY